MLLINTFGKMNDVRSVLYWIIIKRIELNNVDNNGTQITKFLPDLLQL